MAIAFPQFDKRPCCTGGADAWDGDAGTLLLEDYLEPAAGGGTQDLAGTAAAQGAAAGALDHAVPLGGAATAAGSAAGAVAVSVPLAVSAAAAAFTAAQLAIAKAMGGAATGQGSTTAGMLLAKALAAVAVGVAQALGEMDLALLLASTALGQGSATGDLQSGAVGTITFTAAHDLKDNLGNVLANQTGITVHVATVAGVPVITKTGHTTNASGIPAPIADAAIAAGTPYRCVIRLASGAEGVDTLMAA